MKILINILIFIAALLLIAPSLTMLLRNFTFVQPFSKLMVKYNVYDTATHKHIMLVNIISNILLIVPPVAIAALIFIYCETVEMVVLLIGFLISFLITINQLQINQENIKRFCKRHYVCMDMQNFDVFIQDFTNDKTIQ